MKITVWNVAPLFAVLTLASAHMAAGATLASQTVDKTKDAIVKDAKIVADKTEDVLSKTGEVMTDGWITSRVHERFVGEDLLKDSDISVDTSKHVVTLKGTVMGKAGRDRATSVALHTEGVHRVVNKLTIGPKRKD
jgi:hyperosmotically inducible protein